MVRAYLQVQVKNLIAFAHLKIKAQDLTQLESPFFKFFLRNKPPYLDSQNQLLELFKHVIVALICDYNCFPYVCQLDK